MRLSEAGQALALTWLIFVPSPGSAMQSDQSAMVIIEGRVVEELTGAPIAGAQIDYAPAASAVTDSFGRYRMETRFRGVFLTLSAVRPGFLPEAREQQFSCEFLAPVGETPTCPVEFDFELRRFEPEVSGSAECTIRGTVLFRRDRSPVGGAIVRVDGTELETLAGPDGAYTLPGAAPGLHRVTARSSSTSALSRLVLVRCAGEQDGTTLPLLLNPRWIP